jgi:hypothetical protein
MCNRFVQQAFTSDDGSVSSVVAKTNLGTRTLLEALIDFEAKAVDIARPNHP